MCPLQAFPEAFQAFLNGRWVGPAEWNVSISDAGFTMGATVAERIRTFGGRLFRLDAHLQRLFHSLEIVDIELGYSPNEIAAIADEVADRNCAQLAPSDDLGVGLFVTPGVCSPFVGGSDVGPTVCVHPYLLPFDSWADRFETGQALVVSDVVQISPRSWPPELKCRSRMHYFLADKRAQAVDPQSSAVLLDDEGFVTEAPTANVVIYHQNKGHRGEGLVSPPRDRILPGISLSVLAELAAKLDLPFRERAFRPDELRQADEVLLTSTSFCVLPVVRVECLAKGGQAIGDGTPGPVYRRLLAAWSELVGLDIAAQARQFASRVSRAPNDGSKNGTADGRR